MLEKDTGTKKLQADTDAALDWMEKMESLPDVLGDFELDLDMVRRMEEEPEKFLPFAVYMANAAREPPMKGGERAREITGDLANQFVGDFLELV